MTHDSAVTTCPASVPAPVPPVDRARLPEVLRVEDVAEVLGVGVSAARKVVARGEVGPFVRVGRRLYVRRDSLLATLASREDAPPPPPSRPVVPMPKPEFLALLRRRPALPEKKFANKA